MDRAGIVGAELDGANVAPPGHRYRDNEVSEDVDTFPRQRVRPRQLHNEIRFPKVPSLSPRRYARQVTRRAFRDPLIHPARDQIDLFLTQPALTQEVSVSRFRQPWRHEAARRHVADLARARPDVLIREQAERGGPVRTMASDAVLENDGGDVFAERDWLSGRPSPSLGADVGRACLKQNHPETYERPEAQ